MTNAQDGDVRRVAVVTGATGGIGRAVAERLGADGMSVVVVYGGNQDRAKEVVEAITNAGGRAVAARADVADEDAVAKVFDTAERSFGGVDVVVNAAGSMLLKTVAEFDLSDLDRMHRTNIRGTFVINQAAARRVRDVGAIINFSSSVVALAFPTYAGYTMTKGAVDALTMVLARELKGRDITVNAVAPGPTATPLFLDGKSQDEIDELAAMPPLQRLGQPEDIAETVAALAGPIRWVNGQVVRVNGGIV